MNKSVNQALEGENSDDEESGSTGHWTRVPYAIAAERGLDTKGMTPSQVWKMLKGHGVNKDEELKKFKEEQDGESVEENDTNDNSKGDDDEPLPFTREKHQYEEEPEPELEPEEEEEEEEEPLNFQRGGEHVEDDGTQWDEYDIDSGDYINTFESDESSDEETTNIVKTTAYRIARTYGVEIGRISIQKKLSSLNKSDTLGWCSMPRDFEDKSQKSEIQIRTSTLSEQGLQKYYQATIDKDGKQSWHAKCDKDKVKEAVITHEMGHAVMNKLLDDYDLPDGALAYPEIKGNLYLDEINKLKRKIKVVKEQHNRILKNQLKADLSALRKEMGLGKLEPVSGYAKTDFDEFFAEAFAEAHCVADKTKWSNSARVVYEFLQRKKGRR